MKRFIKVILVFIFSIVFIGALLIGFSFVERGELARQIAREMQLPLERREAPQAPNLPEPPVTPFEKVERAPQGFEDWDHIYGESDMISGSVKDPNKKIYLLSNVSGDVEAKAVRMDSVEVNGAVTAAEAVIIQGGTVRQDVNSKNVQLISENNQPSIVYGQVIGQDIKIGQGSLVYGNVGTEQSTVDTAGKLQGNLWGKQIILRQSAVVHGDIYTSGDSVIMEPGAEVRGRFIGLTEGTLKIIKGEPQNEEWEGQDNFQSPNPQDYNEPQGYNGPQNYDNNRDVVYVNRDRGGMLELVLAWIPTLIGILALILLAQSFLKKDAGSALENITQRPWQSLWIGVLTLLAGFPLIFLLGVSIIGIPLAAALSITITAAAIVGASGLAVTVGAKVGGTFGITQDSRLKEAVLGTVLLAHLIWIPVFGWFVMGILLLAGLGGVMMIWWPRYKLSWREWRAKRSEARNNKNNPTPPQA